MFSSLRIPLALAGLMVPAFGADEKVTYNDHVLPIFRNACLNCHNPDKKKAGLDLSTFSGALVGSDNGKVLLSGDAAGSLLLKCVKQTEEPKMPPKGDKLSDGDIALLEKWVSGALLETGTSKAIPSGTKVELTMISLDRPSGPPPMPRTELSIEPCERTASTNAVVALAASPWAPLVALGGQKQVVLYHAETLQALGILPFPEGLPAVLRFSRNGELLLAGGGVGGKSGQVVLWKVATGERIGQIGNEFDEVLGADLSPDHALVALGGPTKVLKIYATKDGQQLRALKKHTDWITAVAFSPDGKLLASADRSGAIELWEAANGQPYLTLAGHKAMVTSLAFMPGLLASSSEDGKITLWETKEGKVLKSWAAHAGGATSVDFATDGRLVSAGRDKMAKMWDATGKLLLTTAAFPEIALRAVLCGGRVVAGDWQGRVTVFQAPDGKALGELTANPPRIAEGLAAAQQRSAELEQAIASAEAGAAATEQARMAELKALKARHAEQAQTAEVELKQLQETLAARVALVPALEKQLAAERESDALWAKLEEAEPSAPASTEARQKRRAETEAALRQAKADLEAARSGAPLARRNELLAAIKTLQHGEPKLPPSPTAVAQADSAEREYSRQQSQEAALQQELERAKAAGGDGKEAQAKLDAQKKTVAEARRNLGIARAQAASAPVEQELARRQAALAELKTQQAANAALQLRWERAAAFQPVHEAQAQSGALQREAEAATQKADAAKAEAERLRADYEKRFPVTQTVPEATKTLVAQ